VWVGLCGFSQQRGSPSARLLARGDLFFAGMNAAAIHCHCLSWPGAPGHLTSKALDMGCTSAASVHLLLAALARRWPKRALLPALALPASAAALALVLLGNLRATP
jgi:hypothetical protein